MYVLSVSGVDQRAALLALADARGHSLAALSAMLRRNPAYLQQFVARGSPRVLAERDRRLLADVLGVEDSALGGEAAPGAFRLPRLDVAASAGPGALVDAELTIGTETLSPALARSLGLRDGSGRGDPRARHFHGAELARRRPSGGGSVGSHARPRSRLST